jgi:hypothetical protein
MTTLRTLKKLLFGETWLLPAGIALVVVAGKLVVRPLDADVWRQYGGFVILAGVLTVLVISVSRTARR